ncbi:MAG: hypothetical protein AB1776_08880 [Bacillota bacterium]
MPLLPFVNPARHHGKLGVRGTFLEKVRSRPQEGVSPEPRGGAPPGAFPFRKKRFLENNLVILTTLFSRPFRLLRRGQNSPDDKKTLGTVPPEKTRVASLKKCSKIVESGRALDRKCSFVFLSSVQEESFAALFARRDESPGG